MNPDNHVATDLFVIKWDGLCPYIAKSRVKTLESDRALASVTYAEYLRRKRRPQDSSPIEESDA